MGKRDPRVDAYIAKSADFAKPILVHIRAVVHAACPEVDENIKWSSPAFMYKGMLCGMAAFKQHATFGFWKHPLVTGSPRETGSTVRYGSLPDGAVPALLSCRNASISANACKCRRSGSSSSG